MWNPTKVGNTTLLRVMLALTDLGKPLWLPCGEGSRIDLIYEEEDGSLVRVQCKTG